MQYRIITVEKKYSAQTLKDFSVFKFLAWHSLKFRNQSVFPGNLGALKITIFKHNSYKLYNLNS